MYKIIHAATTDPHEKMQIGEISPGYSARLNMKMRCKTMRKKKHEHHWQKKKKPEIKRMLGVPRKNNMNDDAEMQEK